MYVGLLVVAENDPASKARMSGAAALIVVETGP
jgi:hypothetical protein